MILTLYKSDCPKLPGISEAKYKVFSSTLKAGCAVLYWSLLKGSSFIFSQFPSIKSALNNFNKVTCFSLFPLFPSTKLFRVKYIVLPSFVKIGVDSLYFTFPFFIKTLGSLTFPSGINSATYNLENALFVHLKLFLATPPVSRAEVKIILLS
ncbi:hypothetical protein D3C85_1276050 [compost metagenome]